MVSRKKQLNCKRQELIRLAKFKLEEILPLIDVDYCRGQKNKLVKPKHGVIGDFRFKVNSLRLATFKTQGLKCVCCGLEGCFFALETQAEGVTPHLNLYAIDAIGDEVLMTHDHIVPRSKKGKNLLENAQVMCKPCNAKKADKIIDYSQEQT
jgi:5-methylcytosine-specific restriction endonuclease McrA